MTQLSFSDVEFGAKHKQTRRDKFLAEMNTVVPWAKLVALVEPFYPKGKGGRPPYALETMLRVHFMQQWFALSDPSMEEALYDMQSLRQFAELTLTRGGIPDETTVLNFRHLLEKHQLANRFLQEINAMLAERGLLLKQGTIIDATFIEAPTSTKNASGKRDPEMHQAKKDNNWHFGMKAHIGTDANSGLVHTVQTTPANGSDISQAHKLVHGEEEAVFGDAGYIGVEKREDTQHIEATWHIAMKRSQRKAVKPKSLSNIVDRLEHLKSSVRSKVEHQFRIIKCQFGYRKTRYRGIVKNTAQIVTLFALSNVWLVRNRLRPAG